MILHAHLQQGSFLSSNFFAMAISPIPFLPPLPVFLIKALCQADCSSDSNDTTESCAGGVWSWDDKEEDEEKLKLPFFCMLLAVAVGVRGNNMSSHLHIFRPDRVCISNCFWLFILQARRLLTFLWPMGRIGPPFFIPGSEEDWLTSVFPPGFSPHSSSLGLYPRVGLGDRVCMHGRVLSR